MSTDTPARLLQLLSLLQTPREWPGGELSERLGVSRRTVRRDVDRLRELGYPVQATKGADGGYRLVAGKAMPPLVLDDEEAVAIAVGLRAGAGHAVEGVDEASVRALAKLEQVLPSRLRHRVSTLQAATTPLTTGDGASIAPETLTTIASTIAGRELLRFAYRAGDGAESLAAGRSRTGSCRPAAAGTSSRTTSAARTGVRSGSTGCPSRSRPVPVSRRASCPRGTRPSICGSRCTGGRRRTSST